MTKRIAALVLAIAVVAPSAIASAETRKFSGPIEGGGKLSFTFTLKRDKNKKIIRSTRRVSKVKVTNLALRFCDSNPNGKISATLPGKFKFQGPAFGGFRDVAGFRINISGPIFSKATKAQGSIDARSMSDVSCYTANSYTAKKK